MLCWAWRRPGDTILIAAGVEHVAQEVRVAKPLCLVGPPHRDSGTCSSLCASGHAVLGPAFLGRALLGYAVLSRMAGCLGTHRLLGHPRAAVLEVLALSPSRPGALNNVPFMGSPSWPDMLLLSLKAVRHLCALFGMACRGGLEPRKETPL